MKKKLLSLALALFMVLAFIPASVMAEGSENTTYNVSSVSEFDDAITGAQDGDTIIINSDLAISTVITKRVNLKGGNEGVTITGNITYQFSSNQENNTLSIEGITFNAPGDNAIGLKFSGDKPNDGYNLNIDVKNCIFSGYSYALAVNSHANKYTLNVSDCDFSSSKYAVNFNRDTETSGQIADNTLVFGSNNVINPDGYAVETFGNTVGTLVKSAKTIEDFKNGLFGAVVNSEESLRKAYETDGFKLVYLDSDITLSSTLNITKDLTIEGQGKTISGNNDSAYVAFNHTNGTFTMNNVVLKEFGGNTAVGSGKAVVKTDGVNAKLYMSNVTIEDFNRAAVDIVSANDFVLDSLNIDCNNSYAGSNKLTKGIAVGLDPKGNRAKGTIVNTNIKNSASNYEEWSSSGIEIYDGADVTIKGGSILNCENGIWVDNYWSGSNGFEGYAKDSSVVIEGINIDADNAVMLYSREGQTSKANVKINSGTFNGDIVTVDTTENNSITVGPDAVVRGEISEGVVVIKPETPSTPVCDGSKDKNCDGVITCDEEKGEGWTWNNKLKVCEYTGKTSYTVVNTAAK